LVSVLSAETFKLNRQKFMIEIRTSHPIAYTSLDHIFPVGTKEDNNTSLSFIEEVEGFFKRKINFLDLGCAGGQLAVDFHLRGHLSVGLEGSDYSINTKRANWPTYANSVLFTCDLTKPFAVVEDGERVKFDCITAWEVIEHLPRQDLWMFFRNIADHLHPDGLFCGSISQSDSWINGINLHQSIFPRDTWEKELIPDFFRQSTYPFHSSINDSNVRSGQSFLICLRPKN
jgi:2-polyprenyl-3-methyl-5-hydroxy-6-metoxy-1,4-benzoquinol methylase